MSRLADRDMSFITIDKGICNQCRYVVKGGIICEAFPDGIPEDILRGEFIHILPYEGDSGIIFEPREGIVG